MLTGMIRAEVDRAVGRMGFVREDELAALRRHVQRLEKQLADLQETVANEPAPPVPVVPVPDVPDVPVEDVPAADVVVETPVEAPKKKKKIIVDPSAQA
jgi:hypothetical protein